MITRSPGQTFDFNLKPLHPDYDVAPRFATPDKRAIHFMRLDVSPEPQLVGDL